MEHFDRITQNPQTMGGKACIRGMRITVGMVVGQIGAGQSQNGAKVQVVGQHGIAMCFGKGHQL